MLKRWIAAIPLLALAAVLPAQAVRSTWEDPARRASRVQELAQKATAERLRAHTWARARGLAVAGATPTGGRFELQRLRSGLAPPLYYTTLDLDCAIASRTEGANLPPYSLQGAGVRVGVWDDGAALTTHIEFNQTGSSRITVGDGAIMGFHATAVTGVILGASLDAGGNGGRAFGAARLAIAQCYNFTNDWAEIAANAAANPAQESKLPVSNHSYGPEHGWHRGNYGMGTAWYWFGTNFPTLREDLRFGLYDAEAAGTDALAYAAPYWLHVQAAGNDRNQAPSAGNTVYTWNGTAWVSQVYDASTSPYADFFDGGGYDTMIDVSCAKNVLAVGAVGEAVTSGARDLSKAVQSSFSSWGPVDDGRVKPDLVAVGVNVRSVSGTGTVNYGGPQTGTSFSAPSVAGAAVLLVGQVRNAFPGANLRAATLKGLLLHTAADLGNAGPDYQNGFGLVDAVAAAEVVAAQVATPAAGRLREGLLTVADPVDSFTITWDGTAPLRATLCWTDPPGATRPDVLDDATAALVNDLDLRITGPGGTALPWVLNRLSPAAPATTGDNTVDTVEQVLLAAGGTPGTYTIGVSHKGSLTNGAQWYGLLVSGQQAPASAPAPTASGVNPSNVLNGNVTTITLNGNQFPFGTQLLLRRSGQGDVVATGEFSSATQVFATLDLTGAAPGLWDVVVQAPGSAEVILAGALTVQDASTVRGWQALED